MRRCAGLRKRPRLELSAVTWSPCACDTFYSDLLAKDLLARAQLLLSGPQSYVLSARPTCGASIAAIRVLIGSNTTLLCVQLALLALEILALPLTKPLFLQASALLVASQLLKLILHQRVRVLRHGCIGRHKCYRHHTDHQTGQDFRSQNKPRCVIINLSYCQIRGKSPRKPSL